MVQHNCSIIIIIRHVDITARIFIPTTSFHTDANLQCFTALCVVLSVVILCIVSIFHLSLGSLTG